MNRKNRQDVVAGFVILLLALAAISQTRSMPAEVLLLPLFTLGTLILLSLILVVRGFIPKKHDREGSEVKPFIVAPKKLATGIVTMALYIIGIEVIGFYLATALFMPITAFALGARNIKTISIASISYLVFIYVVFTLIFERVLPAGVAFAVLVSVSFPVGVSYV